MKPTMTVGRVLSRRHLSGAIVRATRRTLALSAAPSTMKWSETLSFAQAESDVSASDRHASSMPSSKEWSQTMNYASAESDFTASDRFASSSHSSPEWSGSLSFGAPESDFVSAATTAIGVIHKGEMMEGTRDGTASVETLHDQLAVSSAEELTPAPETALGFVHVNEYATTTSLPQQTILPLDLMHPLLTCPESPTGTISFFELLDDKLKNELMERQAAKDNLPTTIKDAMQDERPIVVTTATPPFQVHDVNAAWEGLCGFTRQEALEHSVGELLQGPATDNHVARDMIQYLQATGYAEAVLTNYKKNGDSFTNHIQVGVIQEDNANGTPDFFFVGVLENIHESSGDDRTSMAA